MTGSPLPSRLSLTPVFGSFVRQFNSWPSGLFREGLSVWSILIVKGQYIVASMPFINFSRAVFNLVS